MNNKIYTVTLNPAIDQVLYLKEYIPEITNRLTGTKVCVGGKGTHVSQNLKLMGLDNTALGIVHGATGVRVVNMLEECGVDTDFQYYENGNTRTNYLMIEESGKSTCLSDKGVQLSDADIKRFTEKLREKLRDGDYLILSGDASNCPDPYVYNRIIDAIPDKKIKIFLDASGDTLKKCVESGPFLIKPNRDELEYLTGLRIKDETELREAIRRLDKYKIPVIAVSLGGDGSLVYSGGKFYRVKALKVNVFNTIGCGDCFLSGIIYGIYKGLSMEETLKIATAASAATAESDLSVGFDEKRFKELKDRVEIEIS